VFGAAVEMGPVEEFFLPAGVGPRPGRGERQQQEADEVAALRFLLNSGDGDIIQSFAGRHKMFAGRSGSQIPPGIRLQQAPVFGYMRPRMKLISTIILTGLAGNLATAANLDLSKLPPASTQTGVTFAKDIKPLMDASCTRCHGDKEHKGGIRLTTREGALAGGKEGKIITPGDSAKSQIVIAISQLDPESAMPPKRRTGRRGAPGGTNAPAGGPQEHHHDGPGEGGEHGMGGLGGPGGGPGGPGGVPPFQPPKPLTAEQVGLVRAWIDQGAK